MRCLLLVLVVCSLFFTGEARSQSTVNTDSLWKVYNNTTNRDSLRFDALRNISYYLALKDADSAEVLLESLYSLAAADSNLLFIGLVYHDRGRIAKFRSQYSLAIESTYTAMQYFTRISYEKGLVACQLQLGMLYTQTKDYEKSEENYEAAVEYYLRTDSKKSLAGTYNSLGNMFREKGENDSLALSYLRKSMVIYDEINYPAGRTNAYNNMAGVFYNMHQFDSALKYMRLYLMDVYAKQNMNDVSNGLGNMGGIFNLMGLHQNALDSCRKGYGIAVSKSNIRHQKLNCECLTDAFAGLKQPDSAYHYLKIFVVLKDSINQMTREDEITRQEVTFKYEQEAIKDSLQQVEKERVEFERRSGETNLRIALFVGLGLTLVFAGLMFNRFRITRKQKNMIMWQQTETELQKQLVDEKNQEITDSINYAQRIQSAILPPETELKKAFTDIFVLFKPRDIVSGDFYWYDESANNKVIAVADCTGHGVPGGFMSMLGFEILQGVVMLEEISTTSEALHRLDQKVTMTLNKNDKAYRDGMDMVLCAFPKNKMEMHYSGANRPLLHFSEGVMNVYKPDKHTIGGAIDDLRKDYTTQVIPLKKGDMVYLFTDGYADQFGGDHGKKFMSRKLHELFVSIAPLSCDEQKMKLDRNFRVWKNSLDQVDDVCIVGIRI